MNKLKVQQTGGFPLTTNTLDFMQASLLLMQEFGNIAGDLTILRGCEVTGTQVSNGIVFIKGELLEFQGGILADNVIVSEQRMQKVFEDGVGRDVEIIRKATFGNGIETYPWENFTRITPINMLQKALTPIGATMWWPWSLDNIPAGWQVLDGNGTVTINGVEYDNINMSERVARGFNNDNFGESGGVDEQTLQEVNMVPHLHYSSLNGYATVKDTLLLEENNLGTNIIGIDGVEFLGSETGGQSNKNNTTDGNGNTSYAHYKNRNVILEVGGNSQKTGGLDGEAKPFDNRMKYRNGVWLVFTGQF